MRVEKIRFDSRVGFGAHSYAMWATGAVYRVHIDEEIILITGWQDYEQFYVVSLSEIPKMMSQTVGEWEEIPFSELPVGNQQDILCKMGEDNFPFDESVWGTREAYHAYVEPQTTEEVVERATRWSDGSQWLRTRLKDWEFRDKFLTRAFKVGDFTDYYQIGRLWIKDDRWNRKIREVPEEEIEAVRAAEAAAEQAARKEHARKCGLMARKYGIKFEISLRCFKGDEEKIRKFAKSLKEAIGKEFNERELCAGRYRRSAELERLGIDICGVDPNHIAPYILDCLKAGEVLK